MRILMLTASLPYPPTSGGALRSYGLIHGLHQAGHDITLLSFHDGNPAPEATPLGKLCSRIETVLPPLRTKLHRLRDIFFSSQPDIARRLFSEDFSHRLRSLLSATPFELIQFEGIEVVCYLPIVRQYQPAAKLCFDTFNAEYALQRVIFEVDKREIRRWSAALYSLIQSRRIYRFEREMCQRADGVIAVSSEDADLLREFRGDQRIFVVSNGIFTEDYAGTDTKLDLGQHALVFTGKMDYRPNVDAVLWFVEALLPKIKEFVPTIRLYIVGQQPHPRLDSLRGRTDIIITGRVESVQPYLQAAAVYVVPLRMGSGTRLKLLEAMATGCAIVATSIAASGLLAGVKQRLIVADAEGELVERIVRLLKNPLERAELGKQAQQVVRQHYDWQVLIPRLLAAYKDMGLG